VESGSSWGAIRTSSGGSLPRVKKLLVVAVAAAAGFAVWKKQSSSKQPAQQLWSQATDRV
jgi:hypothetical protein